MVKDRASIAWRGIEKEGKERKRRRDGSKREVGHFIKPHQAVLNPSSGYRVERYCNDGEPVSHSAADIRRLRPAHMIIITVRRSTSQI